MVNVNIKAIESNYNGIMNAASGNNLTINDLCNMICKIMNYEGGIKYLPVRKGEIRHSLGDNSKMKKNKL